MRLMIICLILISVFCISQAEAQSNDSLQHYLTIKKSTSLKGMKVLRIWGIANVGIGIIGSVSSEGSAQYFHQMNAFWGGANLLISSIAINSIKRQEIITDFARMELDQKKVERTILLNAALDGLFIGAGIGLLNWSGNENTDRERIDGYAYSIILQGAFLLVFDAVLYSIHRKNRKKRLEKLIRNDVYFEN